jgi:hypothetical protein
VLAEAEKHMNEANKAFEGANEDCSNVAETWLEPLRLNLELPDYSRLEKPKRPPVPEVSPAYSSNRFRSTKRRKVLYIHKGRRDQLSKLWSRFFLRRDGHFPPARIERVKGNVKDLLLSAAMKDRSSTMDA